jgi:enediyne biosynthesis protein E4
MQQPFSVLLAIALILSGTLGDAAPDDGVLFRDVAADSGLKFVHDNGGRGSYFLPEIMGSGGALFDYDNDGDLDVYIVQGSPLDAPAREGGRLFRNELSTNSGKGELRFIDVTDEAGVGLKAVGMGAAVADYDNDGDLDLLVTAFGRNTLFRNNGDGTFADVTVTAGIERAPAPEGSDSSAPRWNTSAAFLDYDRDGHLDLFISAYVDFTIGGNKVCTDPVGARDYCSPKAYRPVASRLFHNDGNGRFIDVSEAAGIARTYGAGLGVSAGDYDGDGWLDLFVANDATLNQLWINRRNGTFEDRGLLSGTAVNAAGNPEGSMGIASDDYDNDGDEDLFVTNLIGESHALYVNDGRGNFEDARGPSGLATAVAAYTGFGTKWFDYDLDGRLDLFIANGAVNIVEALRGQPFPFHQIDQVFRQGDGGKFVEKTTAAGPAFKLSEVGRGAAFGDVDNDGDVDVLVTNNNGPVRLLLNEVRAGGTNHWLTIRLEQPGNRWGFGARVGVERKGQPTLWRRVGTDGSYLSASDARVHFGLGSAANGRVEAVVVEWPDGQRERWTGVEADRAITLKRGSGSLAPLAGRGQGEGSGSSRAIVGAR